MRKTGVQKITIYEYDQAVGDRILSLYGSGYRLFEIDLPANLHPRTARILFGAMRGLNGAEFKFTGDGKVILVAMEELLEALGNYDKKGWMALLTESIRRTINRIAEAMKIEKPK